MEIEDIMYDLTYPDLIGFIAGLTLTIGLIPQLWRLFQLRSAYEMSLGYIVLFLSGIGCALTYAILLSLTPYIIWNSISFILGIGILYAKLKWGIKHDRKNSF